MPTLRLLAAGVFLMLYMAGCRSAWLPACASNYNSVGPACISCLYGPTGFTRRVKSGPEGVTCLLYVTSSGCISTSCQVLIPDVDLYHSHVVTEPVELAVSRM